MKVIKKFLSKDKFNNIKKILEDPRFPYYYQSSFLPSKPDEKWKNCDFFFCHTLFKKEGQSSEDKIVEAVLYPITEKLNCKKIIRAKVNLYTNLLIKFFLFV